ncbi:hypothetical protein F5X98DRAFT_23177 [Xylaria grammica]|nr:hypothetical protein F5X98DRAFT_23177 [Xylaria grammica]
MAVRVCVPTYRLRVDILQSFLQQIFADVTIKIYHGDDAYIADLPRQLTQSERDKIDDLRAAGGGSDPDDEYHASPVLNIPPRTKKEQPQSSSHDPTHGDDQRTQILRPSPPIYLDTSWFDKEVGENEQLPISYKKEIHRGWKSRVYVVKLHASGNGLVEKGPNGKPIQDTFILKEYSDAAEEDYMNELKYFQLLKNITDKKSENIVKFYCSYRELSSPVRYNIILEYADGGSLVDLFQQDNPPIIISELVQFWESLAKLAGGLDTVHQAGGCHGDIKPSNILIFRRPGSKFGSTFKLADFGTSASQMYSSPERYQYSMADKRVPETSTASGDVWSLGCVFSEALVWSMMGESGRQEYRQSRLSETDNTPLKGSGYDGCFHNGTDVLSAVGRMHSLVLTTSRHLNGIAHRMSRLILEAVFPGQASSLDIYENMRDIVRQVEEMVWLQHQQNLKLYRPPRILSLDGGGLRGLSSLFILRRILTEATGSQDTKPCEYFDMIAGSGTGGLIAILLGRLRLSIDDCINTYSTFASLAFVPLQPSKQKSTALFSSRNIDQALKKVLSEHGLSDYELLRKSEYSRCKVFVCATDDVILRSYDISFASWRSDPLFNCLIREAARATVAVPSLFDPVTIGGSQFMSGGRSTGGGLGIDNPINTVYKEIENVWGLGHLPIIVSIGAARPYSDAALGMMAHKTLGRATADVIDAIASSAEFTASQFARNYRDYVVKGCYFRFNPKTDLVLEWVDVPSLEAQTVAHLESSVDREYFEMCASTLQHRQPDVHLRDIQIQLSMGEATSSQPSSSARTRRSSLFTDSATTELASVLSIDKTNEELLVDFIGTHLLEVPGPIEEMVPQVFFWVVGDLLMRYSDALLKLAKSSEEREVVRFISRNCEAVARDLWEWMEIHSPMKSSPTEQLDRIGRLPLAGTHRAISVAQFAQPFGSSLRVSQPRVDEGDNSPASIDRIRSFLETDTAIQELTQLFGYWVNSDLLHLAIHDNNITNVKALLECGFPVEKVDCKGVDALSLAVENTNLPITKVLLRYMARNATIPTSDKLKTLKAISNAAFPKVTSDKKLLEAAEIQILLSEEDGNAAESTLRGGFYNTILKTPAVPVVSFEWTLPYVVRQDIGYSSTPSEVLSKVVVLTGSNTRYRCTTCSEFINSEWGTKGARALSHIGRALKELFDSIRKVDKEDIDDISLITYIGTIGLLAKISMGRISIFQQREGHIEPLFEVLQWLASAVRSDAPRLVKSTSSVHRIFPRGDDGLSLLSVRLNPFEPLQNLDVGDSGCWVEMFRTGVVAIRALPGAQGWGQGLEIDFGLMVHISAVGVSQMLADADGKPLGYVLAGFRTVLVPVSRQDDATQWHFESSANGDTGKFEAIDPYESRPVKTGQWLKVQDPAEFHSTKCYVGWSQKALILLGTKNLQEKFDLSQSKSVKEVLRLSGMQVNAQTNLGTIIPFPLNVAVAGQYSLKSMTQQFESGGEYLAALNQTLPQVALVLDTESQQAWLVPGLSLHLHMCHRYFSEYKDTYRATGNPIPYAECSVHGHQAAFTALSSHWNTTVFRLEDNEDLLGGPRVIKVWQIFMIANKNLAKSQETSLESKGSRFRGAELQNMVLTPASVKSYLREVKDRKMGPWLPLSNLADVVLVCRNIGLAIQPENPPACDCGSLPRGKYYLAAHTWCLATILYNQRIIESRDKLGSSDHQIGGFRWAPSRNWAPRADCPHHADGVSIWEQPEKVLQTMMGTISQFKSRFTRKQPNENGVEQDSTCIPDTGVLVFGLSQ